MCPMSFSKLRLRNRNPTSLNAQPLRACAVQPLRWGGKTRAARAGDCARRKQLSLFVLGGTREERCLRETHQMGILRRTLLATAQKYPTWETPTRRATDLQRRDERVQ